MRGASEGGPARRTRLSAEQRRETILTAATEVFAASGYRAGKVSDVAARIGVTEPVIFQNFGSKAALFAAVLDRLAGDVRASLDDLAGQHESAASLLAHILGAGPGPGPGSSHGAGAHRTLFGDAASLIADPEAGEAAVRVARIVADHLADLVRRGQQDDSVRGDVNPSAAAWLILSVLSTRPLRAGAMGDASLEPDVGGLALRAILAPANGARPELWRVSSGPGRYEPVSAAAQSMITPGVAAGAGRRRGPPAPWPAVIAKIPGIAEVLVRGSAHFPSRCPDLSQ
jgi:AcrR family transcriptional regulator